MLCCRSLECRHTGCSSASELDTADLKQLVTNNVNSPSLATVLTSASNASDCHCDDSMTLPCVAAAVDNTNCVKMPSISPAHEAVLNRSNAFRIVPSNGVVSTPSYRSTASCQLCRTNCTVRLLPTVAEQSVWMPDDVNTVSLSRDQLVDNSAQLSTLSLTNSLSERSSSSSLSSEM